jgi:hypothetical protein
MTFGEENKMPTFQDLQIAELMIAFGAALVGMTSAADTIGLNWSDTNTDDDWEVLAECAFETFVAKSIAADPRLPPFARLPRYDFDIDSYEEHSWIVVHHPDLESPGAFIRLLSAAEPFDTVQCVRIALDHPTGDRDSVPLSGCTFALNARVSGSELMTVTSVNPNM